MGSKVVKCPRCKGSGDEPIDKFLAVISLGVTALIDKSLPIDCNKCGGSGHIVIRY